MLLHGKSAHLDLETVYLLYKKSLETKKTSYIPYLVDVESLAGAAKESGRPIKEINDILTEMDCRPLEDAFCTDGIDEMATVELIEYADSVFSSNRMTNAILKVLRAELQRRTDVFDHFLVFIDGIGELRSELYFWQPDLDTCDICTLVLSLFNIKDLVKNYREYMKECFILGRDMKESLLVLLKERYQLPLYSQIDVMKQDMKLFHETETADCIQRLVSHSYWCDDCGEYNDACNAIRDQLDVEFCTNHVNHHVIFRPCLSYVEVELTGKDVVKLVIPVPYLDDLYNGCRVYRKYWYEKGVTDKNGDIII